MDNPMRGPIILIFVVALLVFAAIYRITHPDPPPRLCADAPSECRR
jgi:hypothetical protein